MTTIKLNYQSGKYLENIKQSLLCNTLQIIVVLICKQILQELQ